MRMANDICFGAILRVAVANIIFLMAIAGLAAADSNKGKARLTSTNCDEYPYRNFFTTCDKSCAYEYRVDGGTLHPQYDSSGCSCYTIYGQVNAYGEITYNENGIRGKVKKHPDLSCRLIVELSYNYDSCSGEYKVVSGTIAGVRPCGEGDYVNDEDDEDVGQSIAIAFCVILVLGVMAWSSTVAIFHLRQIKSDFLQSDGAITVGALSRLSGAFQILLHTVRSDKPTLQRLVACIVLFLIGTVVSAQKRSYYKESVLFVVAGAVVTYISGVVVGFQAKRTGLPLQVSCCQGLRNGVPATARTLYVLSLLMALMAIIMKLIWWLASSGGDTGEFVPFLGCSAQLFMLTADILFIVEICGKEAASVQPSEEHYETVPVGTVTSPDRRPKLENLQVYSETEPNHNIQTNFGSSKGSGAHVLKDFDVPGNAPNSQVNSAHVPPTAAMEPDAAEKRTMLIAFYQQHNPAQVTQVDAIMEAYPLEGIRESCLGRYNTDPFKVPPAPPMAAMEPNAAQNRARLVAFYKIRNPGQVAQVDVIMKAYTLEAIRESCLQRYNADPFKPLPTI